MALSWEAQIRALEEKAKQKKVKKDRPRLGRCPHCQGGRFRHKMRNRELIRICTKCGSERAF